MRLNSSRISSIGPESLGGSAHVRANRSQRPQILPRSTRRQKAVAVAENPKAVAADIPSPLGQIHYLAPLVVALP